MASGSQLLNKTPSSSMDDIHNIFTASNSEVLPMEVDEVFENHRAQLNSKMAMELPGWVEEIIEAGKLTKEVVAGILAKFMDDLVGVSRIGDREVIALAMGFRNDEKILKVTSNKPQQLGDVPTLLTDVWNALRNIARDIEGEDDIDKAKRETLQSPHYLHLRNVCYRHSFNLLLKRAKFAKPGFQDLRNGAEHLEKDEHGLIKSLEKIMSPIRDTDSRRKLEERRRLESGHESAPEKNENPLSRRNSTPEDENREAISLDDYYNQIAENFQDYRQLIDQIEDREESFLRKCAALWRGFPAWHGKLLLTEHAIRNLTRTIRIKRLSGIFRKNVAIDIVPAQTVQINCNILNHAGVRGAFSQAFDKEADEQKYWKAYCREWDKKDNKPFRKWKLRVAQVSSHAECHLMCHLISSPPEGGSFLPYIAVSKLSCVPCFLFFDVHSRMIDKAHYYVRGSHGKVYSPWARPRLGLTERQQRIFDEMLLNDATDYLKTAIRRLGRTGDVKRRADSTDLSDDSTKERRKKVKV